MPALSSNAQNLVTAPEDLTEADRKAAAQEIQRANPDLFPRSDTNRTMLWMTLLVGLFGLALAAMICSVVLIKDDGDGTALIAIVSAVVAGVIGLFSKSPTS